VAVTITLYVPAGVGSAIVCTAEHPVVPTTPRVATKRHNRTLKTSLRLRANAIPNIKSTAAPCVAGAVGDVVINVSNVFCDEPAGTDGGAKLQLIPGAKPEQENIITPWRL